MSNAGITAAKEKVARRELVGIDIFVRENERNPKSLADRLLMAARNLPLDLQMVTNHSVKVWPPDFDQSFCTDHWRCRFLAKPGAISNASVNWMLLRELTLHGLEVIKTENLYQFDSEKGYSLGHGQ